MPYREGQRAVELLPVEKDAMEGSAMIEYLAGDRCVAWQQRSRLRTASQHHPPSKQP